MKKSELIKELASSSGVTQKKAKEVLNNFINIVSDKLSLGESVKIDGLGRFHSKVYESHNIKAVNGDLMNLEARMSPRFSPSKKLKDKVRRIRGETKEVG